MSRGERKAMISRDRPDLSLSRQCRLLSIGRSSFYYAPKRESPERGFSPGHYVAPSNHPIERNHNQLKSLNSLWNRLLGRGSVSCFILREFETLKIIRQIWSFEYNIFKQIFH